ncbi:hypothetical protein C0Z18_28675 [Trinickia dabaoshanensis]|uniref:RHS repeat-associated core domain-containing protein n=1 Tax=Trinickia dabaoshanensis TaxID=564714 RepID=A0A2N7VDB7_9BURK|nr:hypothetical protein C0Z18_28675 [Trinickia dabaoshanensis]
MHYNRYRYYDPSAGRFISTDPIKLAGGVNLYRYVSNHPTGLVDPLGLVDINNFPTDESIHEYAKNIRENPNVLQIGAHGNPDVVTDRNLNAMSMQDLGDQIKAHPKYIKGMPIQLCSCETGKGPHPVAQKLADHIGSNVIAPDKTLWIWPNGKMLQVETAPGGGPDLTRVGQWRVFRPKG